MPDLGLSVLKEASKVALQFKDAPNLSILGKRVAWDSIPVEHDLIFEAEHIESLGETSKRQSELEDR